MGPIIHARCSIILVLSAPINIRQKPPSRTLAVAAFKFENRSHDVVAEGLIVRLKLSGCAVISKGVLVVEGETSAINRFSKYLRLIVHKKPDFGVKFVWRGKVCRPSFCNIGSLGFGPNKKRVEFRVRAEGKRAKKLRKKLMTDEERLIYNLRRAKKKIALLLQKLKKYELPELPPSRHDPELFKLEQLQAYKKIGFRNKNYVPVGVHGVFGGVVQNMHLHWKFHETRVRYDSDFVIHCKPNGLCEIVGALKGAQEEDVKAVGFGGIESVSEVFHGQKRSISFSSLDCRILEGETGEEFLRTLSKLAHLKKKQF
ncbi:hypothetical protein CASFOL_026102 [Castilleja foliolosa]|uniref:Uncharacterized protein n=1 Tax=Castilleja foliolosa TaxID=1961234 RepID=A0ABD3CSZ9_9LAMI